MKKTKEVKLKLKTKPAPFWKRVVAYIIDLFIINLVIIFPFKPILKQYDQEINFLMQTTKLDPILFYITISISILTLLYFTVLEFKIHQTVGKLLMGLFVNSKIKKRYSFGQILIRNITKPFPLILLVDVLYLIFKRKNQRLFEVFSQTEVLEQRWSIK